MLHHGLGDVVCALPMLAALDRNLPPSAKLLILVKSPLEESLVGLVAWNHAPEIRRLGAERGLRALLTTLGHALRVRIWRADILLAPHAADSFPAAIFSRLSGARITVGPSGKWGARGYSHQIHSNESEHKTPYYGRFAQVAGLIAASTPWAFPALKMTNGQASGSSRTLTVCFAPGSGVVEKHKRWPPENYAALALRLAERPTPVRIVVMGSRSEAPLLEEIRDRAPGASIEIRVCDDLSQSMEILCGADLVVSGCSGSTHLAALAGRTIVGLFGPTNPQRTGPFSEHTHILRRGYACSPCYRPGFLTGCGQPVCMSEIGPPEVEQILLRALAGEPPVRPPELHTTQATEPDRRPIE